jgi:hypothetical protein
MKTVFAIVCSATPSLHSIKFYATRELAQKQLKLVASERRHKMGVDCFVEEENRFSYLLGWEEHKVSFAIVEIPVEEEEVKSHPLKKGKLK